MYVPVSSARLMSTRPRASGTTYLPVSGKTMLVQDSHSATVPVTTMDRGQGARIVAPIRWWARIQGAMDSQPVRASPLGKLRHGG